MPSTSLTTRTLVADTKLPRNLHSQKEKLTAPRIDVEPNFTADWEAFKGPCELWDAPVSITTLQTGGKAAAADGALLFGQTIEVWIPSCVGL
jgi:hypothetical protein